MRAIITVIGKDKVGIIAKVTTYLAEQNVNVLDITQTLLQDIFTMIMLVDLDGCNTSFGTLSEGLAAVGEKIELSIRIQNEEIFDAMHRI